MNFYNSFQFLVNAFCNLGRGCWYIKNIKILCVFTVSREPFFIIFFSSQKMPTKVCFSIYTSSFSFSSILRCRNFVLFLRIGLFFIWGCRNIRFRSGLPATWRRRRWRGWRRRIWRRRWWWRWWVLMSFDDFFTDGFRGIGQLLADCIYWFLKLIKRKKCVQTWLCKIQMFRNVK